MTPPRCEPPEEWRNIKLHVLSNTGVESVWTWYSKNPGWLGSQGHTWFSCAKLAKLGYSYIAPVLTPDEIAEREAKLERQIEDAITQRDDAEEAISQAYYLITGRSPEWSNLFGFNEAIEEIDDAQTLLRKALAEREAAAYRRGQEDMRDRAELYFRRIGLSQEPIYNAIAALPIKDTPDD